MKQDWSKTFLMDIASVSTGKWDANHATENGEYRFYTCAYDYSYCDTKRFEGECLILPGNGVNVGEVFYYDGEFDAYQRTYVISDIKILPMFLHYHMQLHWRSLGTKKQYGSATNFIKIGNFKEYEVEYPPLPEQQRIVSILDKAFAAIDKAKANAEQNLKNAKELFESYLQGVFEKKGNGWEEKPLINLTTKIGSGATPRGGQKSYKTEGISLVRSMNVHDSEFRKKNLAFIDEQQAKALDNVTLQENDVLLNITGASVARCCVIPKGYLPARVNQHVSIIRANKEIIDPIFLNLLLTSKYYKDQLLFTGEQGATRQAITKAQIEVFKIDFPSLEVQKTIVQQLDALRAKTQKMEAIYQKKIADLEELKKSVLQKAFAGELKVSELGWVGLRMIRLK